MDAPDDRAGRPETPPDSIVVTGTGRAPAAPDALVVELRIEGHGATVTEALDALTRASDAAATALPGHRLRTHGLGLHPRTGRDGEARGHTAYSSLRVRTDDPAGAGRLIARLAEEVGDGLSVEQLRPQITDLVPHQLRAREAAVQDARTRAEHYASLLDRTIGPALWLQETAAERPVPVARAAMAVSGGPEVDPAEQEIVASVQVAWRLLV